MANRKSSILRSSTKLHKWLGWGGGIALLIFAISGFTHPLMTWTGPKAASFFPPQVKLGADEARRVPQILAKANIKEAIMVKIIPAKAGPLLQVTKANEQPRLYFDLKTGEKLKDYDQQHALWLARYYTGLKTEKIKSIHFQTEFDNAYPWVNRLLPVYRVQFETEDNRTAFIYTELSALAGLSNDWRTSVQTVFRALHTWTWLNDFEYARLFLMLLLLLTLTAMAMTGCLLVFMIKKRKINDQKRKWHRMMSFAIWLPLLLFSASGIYHLLQSSFGENLHGLKLGHTINVSPERFGNDFNWLEQVKGQPLNALSIVENINPETKTAEIFYRISVPNGQAGKAISRKKRFKGMGVEKQSLYVHALSGKRANLTDKQVAIEIAEQRFGYSKERLQATTLITHFGPHYDFRNKRLPVWQLDYNTSKGDKLFIDPSTGMLVDRLVNAARYEGYSFSFLHKWNFLSPLIGREKRDIIISLVLITAMILTLIGYFMLFKRHLSEKRHLSKKRRVQQSRGNL